MLIRVKVTDATNCGSPSCLLVTGSFDFTVVGTSRKTTIQFPVSKEEYPADRWPPAPGDVIPVEFDLANVARS